MDELARRLRAQRELRDAARRLVRRDVETLRGPGGDAADASARLRHELEDAARAWLSDGVRQALRHKGKLAATAAIGFAGWAAWLNRERIRSAIAGTGDADAEGTSASASHSPSEPEISDRNESDHERS